MDLGWREWEERREQGRRQMEAKNQVLCETDELFYPTFLLFHSHSGLEGIGSVIKCCHRKYLNKTWASSVRSSISQGFVPIDQFIAAWLAVRSVTDKAYPDHFNRLQRPTLCISWGVTEVTLVNSGVQHGMTGTTKVAHLLARYINVNLSIRTNMLFVKTLIC